MKKLKKILVLGLSCNIGGIETLIYNLFKGLSKEKFSFDFVKRNNKPIAFEKEFTEMGCQVFKVTSYYKNNDKFEKEINKIINHGKYDMIYVNMNSLANITSLLSLKNCAASIIVHAHSSNSSTIKKRFLHKINKLRIEKIADYYFASSRIAGEYFYNKRIINSNRYFITDCVFDINMFKIDKQKRLLLRDKLNVNDNEILLTNVGKISKTKNQIFLVKILKRLNKNNYKLLLIGNDSNSDKLKKYIKINSLQDKIFFVGMVKNVNDYLNATDIFLFPSLYEGFGIALLEAQMFNIPCIASTSVPKETKITENLEFLDLKLGVKKWAKAIYKISNKSNTAKIDVFEISKRNRLTSNKFEKYLLNIR